MVISFHNQFTMYHQSKVIILFLFGTTIPTSFNILVKMFFYIYKFYIYKFFICISSQFSSEVLLFIHDQKMNGLKARLISIKNHVCHHLCKRRRILRPNISAFGRRVSPSLKRFFIIHHLSKYCRLFMQYCVSWYSLFLYQDGEDRRVRGATEKAKLLPPRHHPVKENECRTQRMLLS